MEKYMNFIIIGITTIYFFFMQYMMRKTSNDLKDAMMNHPEKFEEMINKPLVKFLYRSTGLEFIRINFLMTHGTKEEVYQQFLKMDSMKINKKQKNQLYQTLLQYYVLENDKDACIQLMEKYNDFADANNLGDESKLAFKMEIKMFFEKTLDCIEYIDEKMEFSSEQEKVVLNYKKAVILKANDKIEEAKECVRYILEATVDENQRKIMQEALDNNLETL